MKIDKEELRHQAKSIQNSFIIWQLHNSVDDLDWSLEEEKNKFILKIWPRDSDHLSNGIIENVADIISRRSEYVFHTYGIITKEIHVTTDKGNYLSVIVPCISFKIYPIKDEETE